MLNLLKRYFGYTSFRPLQQEIVSSIMEGNDTLVIMPTGGGKSLCYQLPAIAREGVSLVISPLIALMKDQVDTLRVNGISAAYLNSSLNEQEKNSVHRDLSAGNIKLLYIAPERLAVPGFLDFLRSLNIQLLAIDEAHCISEWGHDFRPDYHNLDILKITFPHIPVIALTATATKKVQEDIVQKLGLKKPNKFLGTFDRPNLTLRVMQKRDSFEKIVQLLKNHTDQSAIIYCFSRKETESMAEKLRKKGFSATAYHAGLSPSKREQAQERFIKDDIDIITATVAFGMGIDKPDVRLVIHYVFPKTIEGYYQEIGRAGRDGLPSECVLFYSYGDKRKHDFFINQLDNVEEQYNARQKLQEMITYCDLTSCRRRYLLSYFGESSSGCETCDICLRQDEKVDMTIVVQKILSGVARTGSSFGMTHVIDVLRGSSKKSIVQHGHDQLSVHGIAKEYSIDELRWYMKQLVDKSLLAIAGDPYPTLSVTEYGKNRLRDRQTIQLVPPVAVAESKKKNEKVSEYNETVFEELRKLRKALATERGVPPFMVFSDVSLQEMAHYLPNDSQSFLSITGVGEKKLEIFGDIFLEAIQQATGSKK